MKFSTDVVSLPMRTVCVLSVLISACGSAYAVPIEAAAVPVTLSIRQSCQIRSSDGGAQDVPVVQCEHDEVFSISNVAVEPANANALAPVGMAATGGGIWMVAF